MKRIVAILLLFMLIYPTIALGQLSDSTTDIIINLKDEYQPTQPPSLTAQGAVLIEQETGKILHGQNENKKLYPASTTKILTALIAIELGDLDEIVTVGEEVWMIEYDGSKAGLYIDEEISLRNLIFGLMVNSGNDAAYTIAVHIARLIKGDDLSTLDALSYFSELMNERAVKAGTLNSNFVNPHGYHHPDHYTTAYDLALITREAMKYDFLREAISTISMETKYWHNNEPRYWNNKNRLFNDAYSEYYEYATGGKTGWTTPAGSCLISTATKDGMDLIAVVLKTEHGEQWKENKGLFEYGFNNYKPHSFYSKGTIFTTLQVDNHISDDSGVLALEIASDDFKGVFHKNDLINIEQSIVWNEKIVTKNKEAFNHDPYLLAPIIKNQIVGEIIYSLNDEIISRAYLTAVRDIPEKTYLKTSLATIVENETYNYSKYVLVVLGILISLKIFLMIIKTRRRRRRALIFRR